MTNHRTGKHVIQTHLDENTIDRYLRTGHPRTVGTLIGVQRIDNVFASVDITALTVNGVSVPVSVSVPDKGKNPCSCV